VGLWRKKLGLISLAEDSQAFLDMRRAFCSEDDRLRQKSFGASAQVEMVV
jgi:hypothetical protein